MSTFRISVVMLAVLGAGCGGADPVVLSLEPPAPGEGVQIKMTSTLEAGLETERCMFYRVPDEGLYVNRQEIRYTPGSVGTRPSCSPT